MPELSPEFFSSISPFMSGSSSVLMEQKTTNDLLRQLSAGNNELLRAIHSIAGKDLDPITTSIVTQLSQLPAVQNAFGVSNPNYMASAANAIGQRMTGAFSTPEKYIQSIQADLAINNVADAYLSNNDNIFKRSIRRDDFAGILNWMHASGAISDTQIKELGLASPQELTANQSRMAIDEIANTVSMFRNVLGRNGPIDAILNDIAMIGGTQTKLNSASRTIMDWTEALLRTGASIQSINTAFNTAIQQSTALQNVGFSRQTAAEIARLSATSTINAGLEARSAGVDFNSADYQSRYAQALALTSQSSSGRFGMRALLAAAQAYGRDSDQYKSIYNSLVQGDLSGAQSTINNDQRLAQYMNLSQGINTETLGKTLENLDPQAAKDAANVQSYLLRQKTITPTAVSRINRAISMLGEGDKNKTILESVVNKLNTNRYNEITDEEDRVVRSIVPDLAWIPSLKSAVGDNTQTDTANNDNYKAIRALIGNASFNKLNINSNVSNIAGEALRRNIKGVSVVDTGDTKGRQELKNKFKALFGSEQLADEYLSNASSSGIKSSTWTDSSTGYQLSYDHNTNKLYSISPEAAITIANLREELHKNANDSSLKSAVGDNTQQIRLILI